MPGSTKYSTGADPHLWITVLAGGSGSRFWPVSTPARPKQLLSLTGPQPMVVETVGRARAVATDERIRILTGAGLVPSFQSALPELGLDAYWIEPHSQGTGPALTWAAWRALEEDADAILVSLHSDHSVRPLDSFVKGIRAASALALRERALVTVGVTPDRPETGYGYLQPGSRLDPVDGVAGFQVSAFHEKPDHAMAEQYIGQGYLWNSGIFAWRADVFLEEVYRHAPTIARALPCLEAGDVEGYFEMVSPGTVDEMILEQSDKVAGIRAPFAWDDVGSWEGLSRVRGAAPGENVIVGDGLIEGGSNDIVYADDGSVVVWGLSDVVVVHTSGTTLVMRRDLAPDLKRLLDRLSISHAPAMKLILFHDAEALRWSPFIETRPVGELLYGTLTLRARAEKSLGIKASAYVGAQHLDRFDEPGFPHMDPIAATDGDRIFLCVRAAIDPPAAPLPDRPAILCIGSQVVGWVVPAGEHGPAPDALRDLGTGTGETVELQGEVLGRPWDLMTGNPARITGDVHAGPYGDNAFQLYDVPVLGKHRVMIGAGAAVEPGVIIDARSGPVWLDQNARVEGPARIAGPLYLGAGSTILGGPVGGSSIGPGCRVRGEIDASVISGYCNKAHEGHLGHSVLGRWVNLGAGTTNSDLKNTYSTVRVTLPTEEVDTGMIKVGCFLGDHVKTGIGTLINTGTVVGSGSNLFGGRMPPAYVPLFSWGDGEDLAEYRLDRFLDTVQATMSRRDLELTGGMRYLLSRAFERSRSERSKLKGRS